MAQIYGYLKILPLMRSWRWYSIWEFENRVCGHSSCKSTK